MKNTINRYLLNCTVIAVALLAGSVHASEVIADWKFSDPNQTRLNATNNTGSGIGGPGGRWNVAITGVETNGAGALGIRNDGKGGSGTRGAYADFGPNTDQVSGGLLSLYTSFSGWNSTPGGGSQIFTMGFVEGNDFNTAAYSFGASGDGFSLGANVDSSGNGTPMLGTAHFNTFEAIRVRLDVNLDSKNYWLGYDLGSGYVSVGRAHIDSFTQGVNSLHLGLVGDFTNNPLSVDRIWVVEGGVSPVPELDAWMLQLAGLALLGQVAYRRRRGTRS